MTQVICNQMTHLYLGWQLGRIYVDKNVYSSLFHFFSFALHLPVTHLTPNLIFRSLWESLDINEIAEGCHGGDLSVRLPGRGNGVQWCRAGGEGGWASGKVRRYGADYFWLPWRRRQPQRHHFPQWWRCSMNGRTRILEWGADEIWFSEKSHLLVWDVVKKWAFVCFVLVSFFDFQLPP